MRRKQRDTRRYGLQRSFEIDRNFEPYWEGGYSLFGYGMYKESLFTAWVVYLTFCLMPAASASTLIGPKETQAQVSSVEAIVAFDGNQEQLIERIVVKKTQASGGTIGWVRAFPSRPVISTLDNSVFDEVQKVSRSEQPYYQTVRPLVTAPSLVTQLYRAISPSKDNTSAKEPTSEISLSEDGFEFIEGSVVTSTINGSKTLSREVEDWFIENGLQPTPSQRRKVMQYCEQGWVLALSTFDLSSVVDEESFTLSTTRYVFSSRDAVHPHLFLASRETKLRYWLVSDVPLQAAGLNSVRTNDPEEIQNSKGAYIVTSQRKGSQTDLPAALQENWDPEQQEVYFEQASFDIEQVILAPQYFTQSEKIPVGADKSTKGSLKDVLFCVLLGLAPLFILPESWLLYWVRHQSKLQRTRVNPNPLGTKLWSLYGLALSLFWFISQSGAGKSAAILPLLFGILSIRTQETPQRRVIVTFAKKKKPVKKS